MKVFLGGTVNGSTWRDEIIPKLKVDYFNPVVDDWNEEARLREISERENSDFSLYVLTPMFEGYYSIAEVTDDSYKKADKTIFCYLEEDQGKRFSDAQLNALHKIGKLVLANGGIWKKSLNDVVRFLNSSLETAKLAKTESPGFKDVFISYGRRHSLVFAQKLFYQLSSQGYKVWFDMNDIPLGVDFQDEIDEGIKKADNFVFIISPHSVNSIYCYKEIALAVKYNKRIIPILHIDPLELESKIHPEIQKRNWIYARQKPDLEVKSEDWQNIDNPNLAIENLVVLLKQYQEYVHTHTLLLTKALNWVENKRSTEYLLRGKERQDSYKWLLTKELQDENGNMQQTPCRAIAVQAEYIVAAKKKSERNMSDCFLAYAREDLQTKELIRDHLNLRGYSSWSDTHDIPKGAKFKDAIEQGIAEADCLIFFISSNSVNSKAALHELDLAIRYRKRLIPILIEKTPEIEFPLKLRSLQYIDFSNQQESEIQSSDDIDIRIKKSKFQMALDELESQLFQNKQYFYLHKLYLAKALRWIKFGKPNSMLLGMNELKDAQVWLNLSKNQLYKSTEWHKEYIETSQSISVITDTEVFLAFAKDDEDYAFEIGDKLQVSGKKTFINGNFNDQDSDFEDEIKNEIYHSNNFVFILSKSFFKDKKSTKIFEIAEKKGIRIIAAQMDKASQTINIAENIIRVHFDRYDFDTASANLIKVLETDKDHNRLHNYYARSAKTWETQNKSNDYLLRGQELNDAQLWLKTAENEHKLPEPTSLHYEYINRSAEYQAVLIQKEKQQKRVKRLLVFVLILGLFASFFGFFAYQQYRKAKKQTIIAQRESFKAQKMEKLARSQADSAQRLRKLAEIQKHIAELQKREALTQKKEAILARQLADSARQEAEIQRQRALFLAAQAKRNEFYANDEKEKALAAEQKAQYYLYAFNAKNMANDVLKIRNKKLKIFLSTTATELNFVADSLSKKYGLNHPYMPILLQSMQNTYLELYDNHLSKHTAKSMMVTDSFIYTSTVPGRMDVFKLDVNQNGVELDSLKSLYTKSNDLIYSIIRVSGKIWLNTSGGEILKKSGDKLLNFTSYFPNGVSKIINLPTDGLIQTTNNFGVSTIIDTKRLGDRSLFGRRFLEGRNLELKILKRFNQFFNWDSSGFLPNIIAYNPETKLLFINSGLGEILYVNKNNVVRFPQRHIGMISCITISHNHKWLVSGSFDGSIMLWNISNINTSKIVKLVPIIINPSGTKYINSISFSPHDNFLLFSDNESIKYVPINSKFLYLKLKEEKLNKKQSQNWWQYYKRGAIERQSNLVF